MFVGSPKAKTQICLEQIFFFEIKKFIHVKLRAVIWQKTISRRKNF